MSLVQGSGYLQVTASDGAVTLDTRDELFHVLTTKTGSQALDNSDWNFQNSYDGTDYQSYNLGAVDAGCTDVTGIFQVTYGSSGDYSTLPDGQYYLMGGSVLTFLRRYVTLGGTNGFFVTSMQVMTFELDGGNLMLHVETCLLDGQYAAYSLRDYTVTYRAFCGTFT